LLTGLAFAATALTGESNSGDKSKVKGTIMSRNGDLVKIQDKKTGASEIVKITDDTKIERNKGKHAFFRHADMDVTALVPGLNIDAEGVENSSNQLEAKKITFTPDVFAIEVAEEQQIMTNKAAAQQAQTSANRAQTSANQAQSSADQARSSATQAGQEAEAAGEAGVIDAAAIQMVNQRMSDMNDYKTVAAAGIFFPTDGYTLDNAAKADLDKVASVAMNTTGYLIEISGYASSTGTKQENQKLSEERAAAVAQYLRENKNIPMRRIVAPAGYGASHPAASNTDSMGRSLNRRVDVIVLINQGLAEGS